MKGSKKVETKANASGKWKKYWKELKQMLKGSEKMLKGSYRNGKGIKKNVEKESKKSSREAKKMITGGGNSRLSFSSKILEFSSV